MNLDPEATVSALIVVCVLRFLVAAYWENIL